ncbi:MAG: hypothetical protein KDA65_10500, partial [Planctomycetaceae bacterium]|nr:hypothetical protein [Planctomycetaceae bacterium]
QDLDVDLSGNVFITGEYYGTVDFNSGAGVYNLTSGSMRAAYVLKLTSNGNFTWARQVENSNGTSDGIALAATDSGEVYIAGKFTNTVDLNPGTGTYYVNSAGGFDVFILKLNSNGSFVWGKRIGGSTGDQIMAIDTDSSDSVYLTGQFDGTLDFDPSPEVAERESQGDGDIYINKLDSSGNYVWTKSGGGMHSDSTEDIVVNSWGDVYVTGVVKGVLRFEDINGEYDYFNTGDELNAIIWKSSIPFHELAVSGVGAEYTVQENGTVQLDASTSSHPIVNTESLVYLWDFDGDLIFGETGADAPWGDEIGIQPTFKANGIPAGSTIGVSLKVGTSQGIFDGAFTQVKVTEAPNVLPYIQDFESGLPFSLTYSKPANASIATEVDNHRLQFNNSNFTGLSTATIEKPAPLTNTFELSAEVKSMNGANRWLDGFLIFDYKNENNFKYAGFFTGHNQWIIGHYEGDFNNRLAQVDWDDSGRTINTNTVYTLHVRVDGVTVYLSVDGEFITQANFGGALAAGKVGMASQNAVTRFDNFILDEKVDPGAPTDLPYVENFDDNVADRLKYIGTNRWGIYQDSGDKSLIFNGRNSYGLGVAYLDTDYPLPNAYEIVAKVSSLSTSNVWYDGFLVFDYKGPNNFKYAGLFTGQNEWVIGHYQGNWSQRVAQFDVDDIGGSINADQEYTLYLKVNGDHVDLFVDGIKRVSATFTTGIHNGSAGVAAYNAWTAFDDLQIAKSVSYGKPVDLPYSEDFNDNSADSLYYSRPNYWKVVAPGGEKLLRTNTSYNDLLSVAHVPINPETTPENFNISADIRSNNVSTGWKNGFIIFDYKHENDFKYAGFFTGQNEWIIGHYQGDWNNRLAVVDWDNQSRTIKTNQWYTLNIEIEGSTARLNVDGEFITSANFGVPLNQGAVGLAADKAFTWFDNFQVVTPISSPYFNSNDLLFASWQDESDIFLF